MYTQSKRCTQLTKVTLEILSSFSHSFSPAKQETCCDVTATRNSSCISELNHCYGWGGARFEHQPSVISKYTKLKYKHLISDCTKFCFVLVFFFNLVMFSPSKTQMPTPTGSITYSFFKGILYLPWPYLKSINLVHFRSTPLLALVRRNLRSESVFWIQSPTLIPLKTKALFKHLQNISLETCLSFLVKYQFQQKNLCSNNIKPVT